MHANKMTVKIFETKICIIILFFWRSASLLFKTELKILTWAKSKGSKSLKVQICEIEAF